MPIQRDEFEDKIAEIVGQRVRAERKRRSLSALDLAKVLDCSQRSVEAYEKAERRITLADAVRISVAFGLTLEQLVFDAAPIIRELPRVKLHLVKPKR